MLMTSQNICIFPITHKFKVSAIFLHFKNLVETYFDRKTQVVQSVNGGEFCPLHYTLPSMGITYKPVALTLITKWVLLSVVIDTLLKLASLSLPRLKPH